MQYKELTITCSHKYSDIVSAILSDGAYEGVAVWDKQDYIELQEAGMWDYSDIDIRNAPKEVYVRAYFYPDSDLSAFLDELDYLKTINDDFDYKAEIELKDDITYRDEWKKYFLPIELEKIAIVPEWIKDFHTDKPIVFINPSMAFGTGTHQTTRMCLEAMQNVDLDSKTVLDVGCGSGILGIAALKLGAKYAVLIDTDESAVKVTKDNLALNNISAYQADAIWGTLEKAKDKADIILANITAGILVSLKDLFYQYLNENGILILSGIIDSYTKDIENAFQNFSLISHVSMDCWHCYMYKKG
ncbi:MAG TPA: 50S ribosomal protein L11 methyltransferase [Clostridia bacterium]